MKAVLYARVSTAKNRCRQCTKQFLSAESMPICPVCQSDDIEKSQDTENQLRILRQWMRDQGHEVTAEYVDRATGKTDERAQFRRMYQDFEARKPKTPILLGFWSLDRLSREGVLETLQHLQRLTDLRVEWKSYTEQYLDSTGIFKEAIIAIFAALAKQQRVRISDNTRAGLARAAVNGTRSGKAIGRPGRVNLEKAAELYAELKSYRAVGKAMKVSGTAIKYALRGRPLPKEPEVEWSDPVWGEMVGGIFQEAEGGDIVVRFDVGTGIPHCMNHKGLLSACASSHARKGVA